jgi:RimJ/RimL family protein N-acetyltransferase
MALFDVEIAARQPGSRHRAFGIDVPYRFALPPEFAAAGFELVEATVLTSTRQQLVAPQRPWPPGVEFHVLDLARDGPAVVDLQVAAADARFEPVAYRAFALRQIQRYAAMQRAGLGHWLGLVVQVAGRPVLAASCGLFRDPHGSGLGRFQFVATHPAWRRRGLCTALVHAACRHGLDAMDLQTLALVADPADVAIGIYESLGFRRGVSTWQLERAPR